MKTSSRPEIKARTDDGDKPKLALIPTAGLRAVVKVQDYGFRKYHDYFNYRRGMEASRVVSCALRHLYSFMDGENNDIESGQPHLAHAACRIMFAIQNLEDGVLIDDRFKKPKKSLDKPKSMAKRRS